MPEISQWTRAIVLSPEGSAPSGVSPKLSEAMSQRDWFPIEQHDPYLAMAELCLRERAQTARAGWGLQRMEHLALVIVEPSRWPALDSLIEAVGKYLTLASIWLVKNDELAPIDAATVGFEPACPAATSGTNASPATMPPAAIARDEKPSATGPATRPAATHDESADAERISRAEIDMLLNMEDDHSAAAAIKPGTSRGGNQR